MIPGASCETCRFWMPPSQVEGVIEVGEGARVGYVRGGMVDTGNECRRNEPTVVVAQGTRTQQAWPIVYAKDWCGQWVAARPEPRRFRGSVSS